MSSCDIFLKKSFTDDDVSIFDALIGQKRHVSIAGFQGTIGRRDLCVGLDHAADTVHAAVFGVIRLPANFAPIGSWRRAGRRRFRRRQVGQATAH